MSSSILHIKSEDINTVEKRGKFVISIIGCDRVGVAHACLFAESGFKVTCVDANQTTTNHIAKGKMAFLEPETETKLKNHVKTARITTTNDVKTAVSQSDIIILTSSIKVDEKKKPDYSDLESTCKKVGSSLRRGSLVIITSIVGLNDTNGLIRELLENTSGLRIGADFGLAYSPISVTHKQTLGMTIANHERIIAAADRNSMNAASAVLEIVTGATARKTENMKVAETVKLLESARQDVNVALTNEFAVFCEKMGVDYHEVSRLLNQNDSSQTLLPMLANSNDQAELYLLLDEAEDLNARLRLPIIAREINEGAVGHATSLAKDALRKCGKTFRRARISILGVSQTPNVKDQPKRAARELVRMLESKGAKVNLYDQYFSSDELAEEQSNFKRNLSEALEGADCIMILTGHDQFKRLNVRRLKAIMKMPAAIIDLEGILEPDKIEKEGFIYRGLGRGVWTR